jgi:hypothetical protein
VVLLFGQVLRERGKQNTVRRGSDGAFTRSVPFPVRSQRPAKMRCTLFGCISTAQVLTRREEKESKVAARLSAAAS